jgi:hypothetical protein
VGALSAESSPNVQVLAQTPDDASRTQQGCDQDVNTIKKKSQIRELQMTNEQMTNARSSICHL